MMVGRRLGGDFIGGEMVWWQDDRNMLSLMVYGHLTTMNHLANNKFATKKSTCHQWITLKKLTQFSISGYLHFTFSSSLFKFDVDANTNLSILTDDPCVQLLMLLLLFS